jgi:cysteinyl-tRNA synthetase
MDDLATLNILPAREYPRATDHIPEMVEMISGLVEKGSAYEKDGCVHRPSDPTRTGIILSLVKTSLRPS